MTWNTILLQACLFWVSILSFSEVPTKIILGLISRQSQDGCFKILGLISRNLWQDDLVDSYLRIEIT